jgi:hypothetical protein
MSFEATANIYFGAIGFGWKSYPMLAIQVLPRKLKQSPPNTFNPSIARMPAIANSAKSQRTSIIKNPIEYPLKSNKPQIALKKKVTPHNKRNQPTSIRHDKPANIFVD